VHVLGVPLQFHASAMCDMRSTYVLMCCYRWEIETPLNSAMLAWCAGRGDRIR
jgi:hypothetical protein